MNFCNNCKSLFYEEDALTFRESYEDELDIANDFFYKTYRNVKRCPYCESGDFEKAKKCKKCGEYQSFKELDENFLCQHCAKEV